MPCTNCCSENFHLTQLLQRKFAAHPLLQQQITTTYARTNCSSHQVSGIKLLIVWVFILDRVAIDFDAIDFKAVSHQLDPPLIFFGGVEDIWNL